MLGRKPNRRKEMDDDLKKAAEYIKLLEPLLDASADEMIDAWTGSVVSEETAGRLRLAISDLSA